MRKELITAAILCSLPAVVAAQMGTRITMPPNTRQTGQFPLANTCSSGQTFKLSSQPPADWLRLDPSTVNIAPDSSSQVQLTVSAANRGLGSYRTAVKMVCMTCAASEPPCPQDAKSFPIELTVANVGTPGDFETIPDSPAAVPAATPLQAAQPMPYIPAEEPRPSVNRVFLLAAGALLAIGLIGMVFAVRALTVGRKAPVASGELSAESERHQVRR
jgi:hypothetical protein